MHFCVGCGRDTSVCDGSCRRPLDPPRFCASCGYRLAVQVTPTGFTAACKVHGIVKDANSMGDLSH